jgi:NADH dehydrogenase FAD-containing subunit
MPMEDVLPRHVLTTKQKVTKIDAANNALYVENGDKFTYDNLIVSTGFKYDWSKIKGAK